MIKFIFAFVLLILVPSVFAQESIALNKANQSVVEGTLLQVSKLPSPEGNAYPDCYYTAILNINHIVSGQSIPNKIILVLPGFFSRQYAPEAKYKVGDKVRTTVMSFSSMPDKVRQTQQADEIEDLDLDFFYPQQIALAKEFTTSTNTVPFTGEHPKAKESVKPRPVDVKARAARKEQMQKDLDEINILLAKHGGDWDKWYQTLKGFREQYNTIYTSKTQKWVGDSFFSAGSIDNGKIYNSEFINSIISFKNYLAARNVDLILVRMPNKGEIVEDLFVQVPPDEITNPYLLRMYKELLEADIEIITSIIPRSKSIRSKYPLMYWYQDFDEFHPAEGIAWVIAEELSKRVTRYDSFQSMPKSKFTLKAETKSDFKWPEGNLKFSSGNQVIFSGVMDDSLKPVKITNGYDSPVLLVGSSIMSFPSSYQGGSIAQYFAHLSGIIPDQLTRAGGDSMMLRNIAREGDDFLRNRSVCFFPFIPATSYKALAPLPIFDLDKSPKTLLASYSGSSMQKAISFTPKTAEGVSTYSQDGTLHMWPAKGSRGAEGVIRIKLPDAVSDFQYFTIETEFSSKEIAYLTTRYSDQTDFVIRSDTQTTDVEVFAFAAKSSNFADLEIATKYINPRHGQNAATSIKSIKVFGIKQPTYYNSK